MPHGAGWVDDLVMSGLTCSIVVAGALDPRFDGAFAGLKNRSHDGITELTGAVEDRSELQGILRQLFDLGLDVVSMSTSSDD